MAIFKRRPDPPLADTLTASLRISVTDPNTFLRHRDATMSKEQERAWKYYGMIGEIHTPLNHAAKEVGKAKLVPKRFDGKAVDSQIATDFVDALCSRIGGQAGLLRSYYLNRKVVGEGYLLGYTIGEDQFFDFVSPDEIITSEMSAGGMDTGARGMLKRRTRPGNHSSNGQDVIEDIPTDSTMIRIWNPHPHFSDLADGPLVAMNEICDELIILTASLKAKILSRLAIAGVLFLPQGLTASIVEEPSGDPTGLVDDELIDKFIKSMMRGVRDTSDPASVMPIIVRGPAEQGELIRWITMDREIFQADIDQRQELIGRIRNGLDIQAEVQSGLGEANHWGAWTIQDAHITVEVATEVESLTSALTKDYYWPALEAEGMTRDEAREYYISFDLSELTTRPNMAEDARQASDRGALSPEALRKYSGAADEDAPDPDEYVRWVGVTVKNPVLALWGTPEYDEIDWELVAKVTGKGSSDSGTNSPDTPVGPGVGDPGSPGGGDSDAPKAERPGGA